jgi:hypothetical protein
MASGHSLGLGPHFNRKNKGEEEEKKARDGLTAARGKLIMRSDCPLSPERRGEKTLRRDFFFFLFLSFFIFSSSVL